MVLKHTLDNLGSPSGFLDRKLSELEPGVVKICDAFGAVYHS